MKWETSKQHLRHLRFEKIKSWLRYFGLSTMCGLSLLIIYICLTSGNDTQKMNKCLQKHDINYCNKEVK